MRYSRNRRFLIFALFLLMLAVCVAAFFQRERTSCMGVRIISEKEQAVYTEYVYQDFSSYLLHNGEPAAIDIENSTIYISQDVHSDTEVWDLAGTLELTLKDYQLFFKTSPCFDNLAESIAEGMPVQVLVTNGSSIYMQYDVVFTTLPVLRVDGEFAFQNGDKRDVFSGGFSLWAPNDPDLGRYSVKTSYVHWHVRGGSAQTRAKQAWKLSLKDDHGENKNLPLLGLGSDDDWILNPMSADDTNLREALFMELWNQHALRTNRSLKMSAGEYVEVVINGRYAGVYLLQRRVDAKYLNLQSTDVLLKGMPVWEAASPLEGYEIISTPLSYEDTCSLINDVWSGNIYPRMQMDNFIDTSLYLQFASAMDNVGYKNTFYVLRRYGDEYHLSLIPWDTDMSFGACWDGAMAYNYELSVSCNLGRMERTMLLDIYPELDTQIAAQWNSLRTTVFREDNIYATLNGLETELNRSGVVARDQQRWGLFFGGEDTVENLHQFIDERLSVLDEFYRLSD